ncbi:MAG: MFS transporter [Thermoproteota archaeon]|nr:MFS transporter [Candidatus Brockarchaeota archaeon]
MSVDDDNKKLRLMYGRAFASSLSNGMISPFIYVYAARIGASSGEIGWMHAFNNLFTNSLQLPWGRLTDIVGRKVVIIVLTSLLASMLWIPIALVTEPRLFILLIALQFLLASASVPAWNALIRESARPHLRSIVISNINIASLMGSLIATISSGWLIDVSRGEIIVPAILASISGSIGALILLKIKERKVRSKRISLGPLFRISDIPSLINENNDFKTFLKLIAFQSFFMSFAWPLFTITTALVLNFSMAEIGVLSIIQTVSTIFSQVLTSRLVIKIGKKPLIVFHYISLSTVPLVYCFASSFIHIAVLNIFLGFVVAAGNVTILPYILDIIPGESVGEYTSIYNMVIGIAYFTGSLLGGNMTEFLNQILGRTLSLRIGYFISAFGRLVLGVSFLKIRETNPLFKK